MRLKGKDVRLYVANGSGGSYVPIALSKDLSIDVECEMKEITSLLSGRARRFRPGRYAWKAQCDALVDDTSGMDFTLLHYLRSGKRLLMTTTVTVQANEHRLNGYVYVSSWHEAAPLSGMSTYSVTLTGEEVLNVFGLEVPPLTD